MSKTKDKDIVGTRINAFLIDIVVWGIPTFIFLSFITGQAYASITGFSFRLEGASFLIYLVLWLAYYLVMETKYSATAGKLVMGIRVVNDNDGKITVRQSFVRNIARVVDGFPYLLPYVAGIVSVAMSPTKQRLGDRWANTYVTKNK